MCLRKKIPPEEFFSRSERRYYKKETETEDEKEKLKKISDKNKGTEKAVILDEDLNEIKKVSARALSGALKKMEENPYAIITDGTVTEAIIRSVEEVNGKIIVGKNFATTDTKIKLLSL